MKTYKHSDFVKNQAWICFRVDIQIQAELADVYVLMDAHSGFLFGNDIVVGEGMSLSQADSLLQKAHKKARVWPQKLIITKGDPSQGIIGESLAKVNIQMEHATASQLADLIAPVKREYGQFQLKDDISEDDQESAKAFEPDAYDLCSCASGKKYKFCCKKIFREIVMAMAASEEGRRTEALSWIAKAKAVVGETAEVLCREAIVYSYFDRSKMQELLQKSLAANPDHPRANYVDGLSRKMRGDLTGAVDSYRRAIKNYPTTDRYHLNETYNNLGTALFELKEFAAAKDAWEHSLIMLPSDRVVRQNLAEFIYENRDLPPGLREISPFVQKFFKPVRT